MLITVGSHIWTYLGYFILGILIWSALSPIETLGWWAGWFGNKIYADDVPPEGNLREVHPNADCYIVFLSGVARVSGVTMSRREQGFLEKMADAFPNAVIIDDVFPYAVNNMALTEQPFFSRIWAWILRRKFNGPAILGNLINIRNILQVFTSVDKRYGPIFNQGMAEVLMHSLLRYDYQLDSKTPIYFVGLSGAAQMAVGASNYLRGWVDAPIYIISIGGVFSSEPSLVEIDHLYHLSGSKDRIQHLVLMLPGRWGLFSMSYWNRARRQGRATIIPMGPMQHTGKNSYLDIKRTLSDGTTFMEKTVMTVTDIINQTNAQLQGKAVTGTTVTGTTVTGTTVTGTEATNPGAA
ncbi:MAG: hypothetical protein AAF639_01520 [Chloroflexota bacterium]